MSTSFTGTMRFFLIILITIIYRSMGKSSQLIVCSQPNAFTVQITGSENVVYGTKLLIKHNRRVGIFSYPGIEPVNVVFNESIVEFKGYMSFQRSAIKDLLPERLSWSASGIILGMGTLQKLSSENYEVQECRLFLPADIKRSSNLPEAVEKIIISYAQSCAKENLCQGIGTITAKKLENINRYNELEYVPQSINVTRRVELIMNIPVDIALRNVVQYIKENDRSIIRLPDIKDTYNLGFGMKCQFEMVNGTFEDLSTLKRTEDAFMSNVENTTVTEAGFGLLTTKLYYDYKLEAALIKVRGNILGTIKGLAMAAKTVIFYDKTCNVKLEYMKVTELGKINFEMSGLGPFNTFTSVILTWLTRLWQHRIVKIVEVNIRDIAEKQLYNYICNN